MRTKEIGSNSPDKTVWWKVDLGQNYSIYSINILFKDYDNNLGKGFYFNVFFILIIIILIVIFKIIIFVVLFSNLTGKITAFVPFNQNYYNRQLDNNLSVISF